MVCIKKHAEELLGVPIKEIELAVVSAIDDVQIDSLRAIDRDRVIIS